MKSASAGVGGASGMIHGLQWGDPGQLSAVQYIIFGVSLLHDPPDPARVRPADS
jgi:hypothetical protein